MKSPLSALLVLSVGGGDAGTQELSDSVRAFVGPTGGHHEGDGAHEHQL